MLPTTMLLSASLGLVAAKSNPYMLYGVPKGPGIDIDELQNMDSFDVVSAAVDNSTRPSNTTQPPTMPNTPGLAEPCAAVSSALQAIPSGSRKVIPAELAVRCLQSVPLDQTGNMQLIDDLKLYLEWQSNIAFLKNPPAEYTEQPVDLMGEMDSMKKQLASNGFDSEYDFQLELNKLFTRAYDNHLAWQPDILAGVMQFQRPAGTELVSVSSDGNQLPEIYAYRDLGLAKNNTSFKPSPVRTINGVGVEEYLQTVATQADFHDADTRWNALFPSQPLIASGVNYLGSFRTGMFEGPNTTMAFDNGTVKSSMNVAVVVGDFTGITDGTTFFKKFCSGPTLTTAATTTAVNGSNVTVPSQAPSPSHVGYPKAELIHPNLSLGGYWINDTGYDDVAVMSVPSYESPDVQLFQNIMRDFIRMSVKAGKTKMIFDLRGNGGGNAILGYDSFKQVFPQADQEPFGGTRFRANDALNVVGQMTRDFDSNKTFVQSNPAAFQEAFGQLTMNDVFLFTSGFNFKHQLDANNEAFESWEQMFGPETVNADKFTKTLRYNFSDEVSYTYPDFSVIGFLENANETKTPQPFKAQDIVMLHDGMCSSTCTIVSELLKNQGGVRTIAVGGQPKAGPMQGIAGTKGAQSFSYDDVQIRTQIIYFLGSSEQQAQWNQTSLGKTAFAEQMFKRTAYSGDRPAGGINLKDNLRRDDPSNTPLEFIYEAADCRMFYTAPMIGDVTMVWKGVVDRMFRNGTAKCVEGSTGDKSSISGGGQAKAGSVPPPARAGVDGFDGAGNRRDVGRLGWATVAAAVGLAVYL
ncbi:peptidase S41 family protein [Karstenula rhodostoma CBS 690.94]|uniref:Peptidase S41 family protein n=1 Tax=Karstenula rhodostoma CBS 690.94 TaxID=1392251 RepID=A0A9P4PHQ4_9PLEO|nr:peptidase S41 family protein [Karstenula rhodostoma CBS 690.94]